MTRLRAAALLVVIVAALPACSSGSAAVAPTTTPAPTTSRSSAGSTTASSSVAPQSTDVAEGTLDQNVLADAIRDNLAKSLGSGVPVAVLCPPGVVIKQGATSSCTATIEGQELPFVVTQSDDKGNVDFAAAAALLDVSTLEAQTAAQYGSQKGGSWTADCPTDGKAYLVRKVGDTFDCTFTSAASDGTAAERRDFTVTVKDLDGNVAWAEK